MSKKNVSFILVILLCIINVTSIHAWAGKTTSPFLRPVAQSTINSALLSSSSSLSFCSLLSTSFLGKSHQVTTTMSILHNNNNNPQQNHCFLVMGLRGKRIRKEKRMAKKLEPPPRIATPYGPIRASRPPRVCDTCKGRGVIRCNVCEGRGVIRKTGNRKRNKVPYDRLIQSRWTSVEIRFGHRQYVVVETKGSKKKGNLQLRMSNCCGEPIKDFWIPLQELQDKFMWRMGWTTLEEIQQADGGPLIDAKICFRCKGERILNCVDCDGKGMVPSYEPLYD